MSSTGRSGSIERALDVLLALSIAGWSIQHLLAARIDAVRIALTILAVGVAVLIAVRRPPIRDGRPADMAAALPSIATGAFALAIPDRWPVAPAALVIVAAALALLSFAFLGRSFAVLPALRGVVTRGPYAIVRHPAYAAELAIVGAAAWASSRPIHLSIVPIALVLVVFRIRSEEGVLSASAAYAAYRSRVRYRLVPGVW
jgi:protein-S-isoprenylcysteine O-methyltransferase Ste14